MHGHGVTGSHRSGMLHPAGDSTKAPRGLWEGFGARAVDALEHSAGDRARSVGSPQHDDRSGGKDQARHARQRGECVDALGADVVGG